MCGLYERVCVCAKPNTEGLHLTPISGELKKHIPLGKLTGLPPQSCSFYGSDKSSGGGKICSHQSEHID